MLEREVAILKRVQHPHIVALEEVFETSEVSDHAFFILITIAVHSTSIMNLEGIFMIPPDTIHHVSMLSMLYDGLIRDLIICLHL